MQGILFSQMEPPEGLEYDFHEWYETEHIPARMRISGFAGANRYESLADGPAHLAIYWLDDLGTLDTRAYRDLKARGTARSQRMLASVTGFTRFICEQRSDTGHRGEGNYLSVVAFSVPDEDRATFDHWYESEHTPLLMRAPDWLRVRRYRVVSGEGGPWTDLALHELSDPAALDSPERAEARRAPKREALSRRPWFGESGRWLYRAIAQHTAMSAAPTAKVGI